jgi:hypothetical protein
MVLEGSAQERGKPAAHIHRRENLLFSPVHEEDEESSSPASRSKAKGQRSERAERRKNIRNKQKSKAMEVREPR